ncbi:hypothetical protein [Streptomyces sp. NPDC051636]|uniref:hypothetical protein n=1 Tax=Streptomyces sp. NPDC051636 TaxID=3365663 RepID=UPI0037A3A235
MTALQHYLGDFTTATAAGLVAELVKRRLDKHSHRDDQEPDDVATPSEDPTPEQEE